MCIVTFDWHGSTLDHACEGTRSQAIRVVHELYPGSSVICCCRL